MPLAGIIIVITSYSIHYTKLYESGEIHGFIGKNGAGKTTSMRIISTLEHPDSGDVLIDNISCISEPLKVRPVLGRNNFV